MLPQEQVERETEAAPGETACAAMTCRATVREQPRGRFALIKILGVCRSAAEQINGSEGEQKAPQFSLRHEPR